MVSICYWQVKNHTYQTSLTADLFPDLRHIMADPRYIVDVRNGYVGVYNQLGLKGIVSDNQVKTTERTLKT